MAKREEGGVGPRKGRGQEEEEDDDPESLLSPYRIHNSFLPQIAPRFLYIAYLSS